NNQRIDPAVDWVYLNGTQVLGSAITSGNVTFLPANSLNRSVALAPGGYDVVFVSGADGPELAFTGFGIQGGPSPKPAEGIVSTPDGSVTTPRRIGKMGPTDPPTDPNAGDPPPGNYHDSRSWNIPGGTGVASAGVTLAVPTLYMTRGRTYTFNYSGFTSSTHPFYLATSGVGAWETT
ncbi:MAG: hypothetical protein QGG39_19215, partial [Candidatus Poribacteria bacterium]|nr:hypothetical protein [Candidatus Poribacteria bacterium]